MTDNKPKPPCYKCADRTAECHASCEQYKDWTEEVKKMNEVERDNRNRTLKDPLWGLKTASQYNRMRKNRQR